MKKDKIHIDKLFSEAMNQRTFDVPESFIENLNIRLDAEEKKKRPFFWWLSALFGGVCLFLTVLFILQYHSFQVSDYAQLPGSAKYVRTAAYPVLKREAKHEKTVFHGNPFKIVKPDKEVIINQVLILRDRTKKQNHITLPTHKAIQKKGNKNKRSIQHVGIRINEKQIKVEKAFSGNSLTLIKAVNAPSSEEPDSMTISEEKKDTVPSVGTMDSTVNQPAVSDSDDKIKNASNSDWKKEIQLFGGLGANFIKDSPANKTYLEKLNENQSSILAVSFGMNGNLSYKKFTFGLGLSYSQTGEKNAFDIRKYYSKDSTISEHIIDTILVLDTLGNWIPEIHDTTIYHSYQFQDSTQERTSLKNTYSWISIPINFGYRFGFGKYEVIPRIGAQFNFGTSRNKGRYPNENFNGILEYQAVKFTISYLIQLEARRNFNRWHVFVNPYFKSMINPAVSGSLIRRQYASWGIQFGVGLKL